MSKHLKILILSSIFFSNICLAQIISDNSASSDIQSQQNLQTIKASIKLVEINFNNSQNDYLKFQVEGQTNFINLKGLEFYDDKIFKTINNDFIIPNHQQITLTFNQDSPDNASQLAIFTKSKSLTSTTEQIIIKQNQIYFDFFCWKKAPISSTEQKDFNKIFHPSNWDQKDINSCYDSNSITKNQSLIRLNSQNNAQAWTIKSDQSNSPPLTIPTTLLTKTINSIPETIQTNKKIPITKKISNSISKSNVQKTSKNSKSKTSKNNLNEKLATLTTEDKITNSPLIITEIFPAPSSGKKPDEWIEITNISDQPINLKNWIIDDSDGGSKPHLLNKNLINANQSIIITSEQSKLNLNNKSDQVRLFNSNNQLADLIEYTEAPKNQSYSLINIDETPTWIWTLDSTPNSNNPQYHSITGTIITAPNFNKDYSFQIQNAENQQYQIIFNENLIKGPEAKNIFNQGSQGNFIGELSSENILQLKKYQITNNNNSNNDSPFLTIIVTISIAIIGTLLYLKKKFKWPT